MSFLDDLNQSQLPRSLGYLLKLGMAWADIFSRLSYPSRHSPFFLISVPLFVPSCLSLSISTSCLLERSHFPLMYTRWDLFTAPALCPWVTSLKWDNLCANTLHKADTWMLPLSSLHPWRAKAEIAFLSDGALTFWEPVFVSTSFSLYHLCWDWRVFQLIPKCKEM